MDLIKCDLGNSPWWLETSDPVPSEKENEWVRQFKRCEDIVCLPKKLLHWHCLLCDIIVHSPSRCKRHFFGNHANRAVSFLNLKCLKCNLQHSSKKKRPHYHCPSCEKRSIGEKNFRRHLTKHNPNFSQKSAEEEVTQRAVEEIINEMDYNKSLIDCVSAQEILYNSFHSQHKNRQETTEAWSSVAVLLNSTVEDCKKRWCNLRTQYGKLRRKWMDVPSGSGVVAEETWPYYNQMSFMDPFIRQTQTVVNLPEGTLPKVEQVDDAVALPLPDDCDSTSSSISLLHTTSLNGKRKASEQQEQSEMIKFLKLSTEKLQCPPDKFEHFGGFIAAQLRGKEPAIAEAYMKAISEVMFSPVVEMSTPDV